MRERRIADVGRARQPDTNQETEYCTEMERNCCAVVTERSLHASILPATSTELPEN